MSNDHKAQDGSAATPAPSERNSITLTARQILSASQWAAPDGQVDKDQLDSEWTIGWADGTPNVDHDLEVKPGYVMWLSDYPEEGCLPLDTEDEPTVTPPAPAASEQVETPEQRAFRENESLDAMIRRAGGRPFLERSAQGRKALAQMEAIDRARSTAASGPVTDDWHKAVNAKHATQMSRKCLHNECPSPTKKTADCSWCTPRPPAASEPVATRSCLTPGAIYSINTGAWGTNIEFGVSLPSQKQKAAVTKEIAEQLERAFHDAIEPILAQIWMTRWSVKGAAPEVRAFETESDAVSFVAEYKHIYPNAVVCGPAAQPPTASSDALDAVMSESSPGVWLSLGAALEAHAAEEVITPAHVKAIERIAELEAFLAKLPSDRERLLLEDSARLRALLAESQAALSKAPRDLMEVSLEARCLGNPSAPVTEAWKPKCEDCRNGTCLR